MFSRRINYISKTSDQIPRLKTFAVFGKAIFERMRLSIIDGDLLKFWNSPRRQREEQKSPSMYGNPYNQNIRGAASPPPLHHPGTPLSVSILRCSPRPSHPPSPFSTTNPTTTPPTSPTIPYLQPTL